MENYSNLTKITGFATLCFEDDGQRFQGVLNDIEDHLYGIVGDQTHPEVTPHLNNIIDSDDIQRLEGSSPFYAYDVTIIDHEVNDKYRLENVKCTYNKKITLTGKNINFFTKKVYRGERGNIESQKILGKTPQSENVEVFEGPITVYLESPIHNDHFWVL